MTVLLKKKPTSSFSEFISKVENKTKPKTVRAKANPPVWKVGAKFKRPSDHILGGKILTVLSIDTFGIYAVEDGLFTPLEDCTLVE
jgi:hypothetical protein